MQTHQVRHVYAGVRVDLGEVEAVLQRHEGGQAAAARACPLPAHRGTSLPSA